MSETARKQIKSGLRLGVGIGLFLIGGMLLSAGMGSVVWSATPPHYVVWPEPMGWTELALAAAALLSSAGVWWQLFAGYMLIGSVKSVIVLITGTDLFAPHGLFPRPEAAALGFFGVASILLMWRFTKNRPTVVDRIALTAYLFCFAWRADAVKFSDFDLGLLVGLDCLLLAWAYDRIQRHHRPNHASRTDQLAV
ncbi:MAG: hypothetical protein ACRD4X_16825 [Candidatus Acidiferrales bacterium]